MTRKVVKRYSTAFKQKVVSEIENGEQSVEQVRRRYSIGGGNTVYNWLKKYGKHYQKATIVRVERPGEVDRVKKLEAEKQELESALAAAHLKILRLESTLEVTEEMSETPRKKKSSRQASSAAFKSERR